MDVVGLTTLWYCGSITPFGALIVLVFYRLFWEGEGEQYGITDICRLVGLFNGANLGRDVNPDLAIFVGGNARSQ